MTLYVYVGRYHPCPALKNYFVTSDGYMKVSKGQTKVRYHGYTSQSKSDIEYYVGFTASFVT